MAVYDIADRSIRFLLNELGQSGTLISSRMVGDILYLVYSYYVPGEIDETDPSTYVPALYLGDAKTDVAAGDIMLLGKPGAATISHRQQYRRRRQSAEFLIPSRFWDAAAIFTAIPKPCWWRWSLWKKINDVS